MKCYFDTCSEAVKNASETKSFGFFYSDSKNQNQEVHVHECCELFFCIAGGNSFLIDDKVYDISDGDIFVINQFEAHKVVPDKRELFSRYVMHIHPSFLYENSVGDVNLADCFYTSGKVAKMSLSPVEVKRMTELFEAIRVDYDYGDEMYKKLRAVEILLETARLFSTHPGSLSDEFSHKTVQLAIDYINRNYSSELTLDAVAKSAFVSANQLGRLFNCYCGTTVNKYIISKRITEAKKLLAGGHSVTETAFMCGFNDYANFIRAFKKAVGVPPGKYRGGEK